MEEQKTTQVQRQTAHIVHIQDIIGGEYITQEGWEPNYVKTKWGEHISRIQCVATVIETNGNVACTIDDGSGQIQVRSFDANETLGQLEVGNLIRVVGKIREYQQQRYILPEIIVPLQDTHWLTLHNTMLELLSSQRTTQQTHPKIEQPNQQEEKQESEQDVAKDFLLFIDSLDKGNGVDVTELIQKAQQELQIQDGRDQVNELLLQGEIFEIKPDVIKVLK